MSRILFTRFPFTSAAGGAENQTMWLAEGLKAKGHQVSFLGSCPVLSELFSVAGFPSSRLEIGEPPVTKFGAVSFLWRRSVMLSKLRAAFEALPELPDAVFMLSLSEKILLTDWLSERGVKVFWIEHDRVGRWLTGNPWLSSLRSASKHATTICVSKLSRQKYLALGFDPERVIAIPNGVPPADTPAESHTPADMLAVGTVARLSPEKGVDVLLAAVAELPEVTLRIVGKGPEEVYLRSLVAADTARMGIPRVTIQSSVPDLGVFYSSLDVFVLASTDHDPFGLVAAEAMIRGVPVIVTDQCGIAGSLRDGVDALIVEAGSSEAIRDALARLRDKALRQKLSDEGRKTAATLFSLDAMIRAYETALSRH